MNNVKEFTVGSRLVALADLLVGADGNPVDIQSNDIYLHAESETKRVHINGYGSANGTNDQQGAGVTTITGITQTNPGVVTAASHGLSNGDEFYIFDVVGMIELNGKRFEAANVATNTIELKGIDTTRYRNYASGGRVSTVGMVSYSFGANDLLAPGLYRYWWRRVESSLSAEYGRNPPLFFRVVGTP